MKFGWKDFFYFQKSDRNATIVLLLLIIVCGILLVNKHSVFKEDNVAQQKEALSEFDKFQNEMTDVSVTKSETKADTNQGGKQSTAKLKEGETIDLNTATTEILQRIPGVGESYARRIYDYKGQLGGFASVDQLKEVQGFSGKRYDKTAPYVRIGKANKKIKINKLSKKELTSHPYLNDKQADCILATRHANKKINNFQELLAASEFTPRDAERLSPYISFD